MTHVVSSHEGERRAASGFHNAPLLYSPTLKESHALTSSAPFILARARVGARGPRAKHLSALYERSALPRARFFFARAAAR